MISFLFSDFLPTAPSIELEIENELDALGGPDALEDFTVEENANHERETSTKQRSKEV